MKRKAQHEAYVSVPAEQWSRPLMELFLVKVNSCLSGPVKIYFQNMGVDLSCLSTRDLSVSDEKNL